MVKSSLRVSRYNLVSILLYDGIQILYFPRYRLNSLNTLFPKLLQVAKCQKGSLRVYVYHCISI